TRDYPEVLEPPRHFRQVPAPEEGYAATDPGRPALSSRKPPGTVDEEARLVALPRVLQVRNCLGQSPVTPGQGSAAPPEARRYDRAYRDYVRRLGAARLVIQEEARRVHTGWDAAGILILESWRMIETRLAKMCFRSIGSTGSIP